jgi:GntR family transcriptional regulator of arabinose operon
MENTKKKKYKQAKEVLIERFNNENYENYQKIPTENELIDEMGFSRNTIRQAITELETDGIVRKEQGRGTFYIGITRPKTARIGVVNFFMARSVYPYLLHGIEEVIWHEGYSIIQSSTGLKGERELEAIKRIVDQGVEGIIYEPHQDSIVDGNMEGKTIQNYLSTLEIPVVTTHFYLPALNCSSATIDDAAVGYQAVEYLFDHGHKDIGIFYINNAQSGISRCKGFKQALRDLNLSINPKWEVHIHSDDLENPDSRIVDNLTVFLQSTHRPTAMFCFNDELAVMIYEAARNSGLTIGRDLSIIGVDNINAAEVLHPGLTTFDHPKEDLGKWAARLLKQHISNPDEKNVQIVFHPELIERKSVATIGS